jgi:hypothetical protein
VYGALHAFSRNANGTVVSAPNVSPIRFECLPGSSLPKTLRALGYAPRKIGTIERLISGEGNKVAPTIREIYEIDLPV